MLPSPSTADAPPKTPPPDAPETDPIRVPLEKAKADFDAAADQFKKKVHDALDKAEEIARATGKSNLVDEIKAERDAFESAGDMPKMAPASRVELNVARRAVVDAYEDAIKAYTKDNKDAKAKTAAEELKAFEEAHPLDAFRPGSVWTGKSVLVWIGHPDRIPGNVTLTVLERDDKTFKATFDDGDSTRTVSGKIRGNDIEWLAKDVEVVKGIAGYNFTGKITGTHLFLRSLWNGRYFRKPFSPARIELAAQLRLQK